MTDDERDFFSNVARAKAEKRGALNRLFAGVPDDEAGAGSTEPEPTEVEPAREPDAGA